MGKFSPGPWNVGSEYDYSRDEIEAEDGRCIAVVWTRGNKNDNNPFRSPMVDSPEGKANARLIAAAPELLDACQWLIQFAEKFAEDSNNGPTMLSCIMQAKSAVAKATGVTNG